MARDTDENKGQPIAIDWSQFAVKTDDDAHHLSCKGEGVGRTTFLQTCVVAGSQLATAMPDTVSSAFGDQLPRELFDGAMEQALNTFKRMKPQDPMEEMLLTQAIATHARMIQLNQRAMEQTDRKLLQTACEAADRAANTFRRQMLALRDYRRPRKSTYVFGQNNVAEQQIVQNSVSEDKNATNEQGFEGTGAERSQERQPPQALPTDAGRPDPLAEISRTRSTVEAQHGSEDS